MDGISIYRKDLDPYLAKMATDAGAELRTSTVVSDVIMENGVVKGVKTDAGETFMCEVVIAADGAMSTMARNPACVIAGAGAAPWWRSWTSRPTRRRWT